MNLFKEIFSYLISFFYKFRKIPPVKIELKFHQCFNLVYIPSIAYSGLFVLTWIISMIFESRKVYELIWNIGLIGQIIFYFLKSNNKSSEIITFTSVIVVHHCLILFYKLIKDYSNKDCKLYFSNKLNTAKWYDIFIIAIPYMIFNLFLGSIFNLFSIYDGEIIWSIFINGIFVMILGSLIESISNIQMFILKTNYNDMEKKVLKNGLWAISRHPNYFGENIFWLGVFISVLSQALLFKLNWFKIQKIIYCSLAPIVINVLFRLVFIPRIESSLNERFGNYYKSYQKYTSCYIPWFPRKINTLLKLGESFKENKANHEKVNSKKLIQKNFLLNGNRRKYNKIKRPDRISYNFYKALL